MEKQKRQKKQLNLTHYVDEVYFDQSPCGNKEDNSFLSDNLTMVDCKDCLKKVFQKRKEMPDEHR